MRCANSLTSLLLDFDAASLPASMSTWLAVTTIAAICASFGPADCASTPDVARARTVATTTADLLMEPSLCWLRRLDEAFAGGVPNGSLALSARRGFRCA